MNTTKNLLSVLAAVTVLSLCSGCTIYSKNRAYAPLRGLASAQKDTPRLAVIPFESSNPYVGGETLADRFSEKIFEQNLPFELVERIDLAKILDEQKMVLRGLARNDEATQTGSVLGVDFILTGSVQTLETIQSQNGSIAVTVKLIEVATGRIAWMGREKISLSSWKMLDVPVMAERLMHKASEKLVAALASQPIQTGGVYAQSIQSN